MFPTTRGVMRRTLVSQGSALVNRREVSCRLDNHFKLTFEGIEPVGKLHTCVDYRYDDVVLGEARRRRRRHAAHSGLIEAVPLIPGGVWRVPCSAYYHAWIGVLGEPKADWRTSICA